MDNTLYRAFIAIGLSFLILFGYQYLFVKPAAKQQKNDQQTENQQRPAAKTPTQATPADAKPTKAIKAPPPVITGVPVDKTAADITLDTPLYTAVCSEQGGGFKRIILKKYRSSIDPASPPMNLIQVTNPAELPLLFTVEPGTTPVLPHFKASKKKITLATGQENGKLVMQASLGQGLEMVRTLSFHGDSYLMEVSYQIKNNGNKPRNLVPTLSLTGLPFTHGGNAMTSRYLYHGPAAYIDNKLITIKTKKLKKGPFIIKGAVSWTGYEDNYFINAIIPVTSATQVVTATRGNGDKIRVAMTPGALDLAPGKGVTLQYKVYFGPKKLSILKQVDHQLAKAVNFGWFDMLAKPMLWLLNFMYDYLHNYGVAIILLTILIKAVFWPITNKGMKSMKNMQKLQPKVAKLKEKYKDDPTRMNQEMMALYKTYKVNPVGGCLPMIIQIPFFFALYRVLMSAIELRHAPFMLWINDLSAPDRLMIGVDIPYVHGIPVLTLLMGASMYLQQKMTPTTADPTQAKIMQFLPILFTFMFLNFASGLVLYWFVNNLLSILQQQLINRQTRSTCVD